MDAACFSTANPYATLVTGAQIAAALERGLDPAISELHPHGFRGTPVGIPQISGMVVEYDPAARVGARVRRVLINGEPLEAHQFYRLAHTDAETIADAGCLVLAPAQESQYDVPTIVREVMEAYIRRHSPVSPVMGRWRVVQ